MRTYKILVAGTLILAMAGCNATQPAYAGHVGKDAINSHWYLFTELHEIAFEGFAGMSDTSFEEVHQPEDNENNIDYVTEPYCNPHETYLENANHERSIEEMCESEFEELYQRFLVTFCFPEEISGLGDKIWHRFNREVISRDSVRYIVQGGIRPARMDADFGTIERVVFVRSVGIFGHGFGFVIDRTHGRVFYNPEIWNVLSLTRESRTGRHNIYADFREEDLARFVEAAEKANVRGWRESLGSFHGNTQPGQWRLGIEFSDGSIMRRGGGGESDIGIPPEYPYSILTDFIKEIGAEIIERHNAESQRSE